MKKIFAISSIFIICVTTPVVGAKYKSSEQWERAKGKQLLQELERFELYAGCRPISVSMGYDPHRKGAYKLVRNKLFMAGIFTYARNSDIYLSGIFMVEPEDKIISNLDFHKNLFDKKSNVSFSTATWSAEYFQRVTDPNPTAINLKNGLAILSRQVDKFIAEYLRVNEAACKKRGILK